MVIAMMGGPSREAGMVLRVGRGALAALTLTALWGRPYAATWGEGLQDLQVEVHVRAACPELGARKQAGNRELELPARMRVRIAVKAPDRARVDVLEGDCENKDWCLVHAYSRGSFAYDGMRSTSWIPDAQTKVKEHELSVSSEGKLFSGVSRQSLVATYSSVFAVLRAASAGKGKTAVVEETTVTEVRPARMSLSGRLAREVRVRHAPEGDHAAETRILDDKGEVLARAEMRGEAESLRTVHLEISEGPAPCIVVSSVGKSTDRPGKGEAKPVSRTIVQRWYDGRSVDMELIHLPEGMWVPKRVTVKELGGKLRVVAEFSDYRVNTGIPDSFFDLKTLEAEGRKKDDGEKGVAGRQEGR